MQYETTALETFWAMLGYLFNKQQQNWKPILPEFVHISKLTNGILIDMIVGPLVGHMIENMQSKMEGTTSKQKAFVFSSVSPINSLISWIIFDQRPTIFNGCNCDIRVLKFFSMIQNW